MHDVPALPCRQLHSQQHDRLPDCLGWVVLWVWVGGLWVQASGGSVGCGLSREDSLGCLCGVLERWAADAIPVSCLPLACLAEPTAALSDPSHSSCWLSPSPPSPHPLLCTCADILQLVGLKSFRVAAVLLLGLLAYGAPCHSWAGLGQGAGR